MRTEYKEINRLNLENSKLQEENTKLRIALCNLRDEFLDLGGDPEQLELFDKNNPSQLDILNENT